MPIEANQAAFLKGATPLPAVPEHDRDGKKLPPQNTPLRLAELAAVAVVAPAYLAVVIPTAMVTHAARLLLTPPAKRTRPAEDDEVVALRKVIPFADRKYDVVLLGATGFTGKMAAKYLAKQYGATKVSWALAGRNVKALEELREGLGVKVDVIPVDALKEDTIHALVQDARCVISTAGPFALYGTQIVRHCAFYGTHYCDLTGELQWAEEMVDRFDDVARAKGARIVHSCGHDSVPWDLLTLAATVHRRQKSPNAQLASIDFVNKTVAMPSGGTLASAANVIYAKEKYTPSVKFNPLYKGRAGGRAEEKLTLGPVLLRRTNGFWQGPSPMAEPNSKIVARSNALLGYGKRVRYAEGQAAAGFLAALASLAELVAFVTVLLCRPLLAVAQRTVLPPPGKGPSERFMDTAWLHVTGRARFEGEADETTATIYFPTDPGYRDTARMLVESGLALALTPQGELPGTGGVLTPASGIGLVLLERLCATGSSFHIQ